MTLSRRWTKFNKVLGNRIAGPLLRGMPGFGVVLHRGRKSGREYQTPVKIFRHGDGYAITLPYGPGADWVRNVLAADGCDLIVRGRRIPMVHPEIVKDDGSVHIRKALRFMLRGVKMSEIILLTSAPPQPGENKA